MANRNLLHRSKLGEFINWLVSKGYEPKPGYADFEALRWKVAGKPMPIIFDGKSPEHLSCNEASVNIVYEFINESKTNTVSDEVIRTIALHNGFKLKEQPDGTMDLNPYVYEFAKALITYSKNS